IDCASGRRSRILAALSNSLRFGDAATLRAPSIEPEPTPRTVRFLTVFNRRSTFSPGFQVPANSATLSAREARHQKTISQPTAQFLGPWRIRARCEETHAREASAKTSRVQTERT